jgi:putative transposase
MCRVLEVSRAGFYAARGRAASVRAQADVQLAADIREIHRESQRRYGSPRIHRELKARGTRIACKRVARLMRQARLRARKRRRYVVTTNSAHGRPTAPNLLARRFGVATARPDEVWVADLTFVPTEQGWLYLAVVIDLATRRVVGWGMGTTVSTALTTRALQMALEQRPHPPTLHHSDRGVQYASAEYGALLQAHGITASMSRTGDCWDNAVAESFFATLEWELIDGAKWRTRQEAMSAIFEYIEIWYNRKRRHSSLGYLSPAEFEAQLALTPRVA